MLRLAVSTLRGRWPALTGAFVALALGATLSIGAVQVIAAVSGSVRDSPERYRASPLVVAASPTLRVAVGRGDEREVETDPNPQRAALDSGLAGRLAGLPGVDRVVVDRSFPVREPVADGAETVGHPWSASAVTPYRIVTGRAPAADGEVVATAGGIAARVGATPVFVTPGGPSTFRVVGVAASRGNSTSFERPLFFSDAQAAELAPAVDAIAVWPAAARPAVRTLLRGENAGLVALQGNDRREAEQNPAALIADGAIALLSIMAMTVGFVAIFVIASTFAFAATLRRRELGLLRAVGATPRQVRRLVLREAAILAGGAAAVGAAGSVLFAPVLARWVVDRGLAPETLTVAPELGPMLVGAAIMLLVALIGAWAAAWRASRVRPAEALRDAAVDRGVMTRVRWVIGALAIGGAGALTQLGVSADIEAQLPLTFGQAALLILGLAMIAPVVIPRLVALLVLPAAASRGPVPLLVREHARAAVRRTAATAAPVLVAVGLTASLAGMIGTIEASGRVADRARVASDAMVVTAGGSPGLSANDLAAMRAIPGLTVGATLEADLRVRTEVEGILPYLASGVDPPAISLSLRTPAITGSLSEFRGDTIALGELAARARHKRVGDRLGVWLPDGTHRELEVVAVLADGLSSTGMYVPRSVLEGHAGPIAASAAYVDAPGDNQAGVGALRRLAEERGLTVRDGAASRAVDAIDSSHMNRLALLLIVGVAVLYVAVALASTAAVATVARRSELATVRLAGGTRSQVTRLVVTEALVTTAVGALLGFAVAGAMTVSPAAQPRRVARTDRRLHAVGAADRVIRRLRHHRHGGRGTGGAAQPAAGPEPAGRRWRPITTQ